MKQETLEDAAERYLESKNWRNLGSFNQLQNIFTEGAKWQAERMYSYIDELRNDLYDKLPIGDVDAFEILKVIKNHLQKLDALCGNK